MRFAIAYHTPDKKRFLIVAELIEADKDFERWKISPKDGPEKAIIVQSDRPAQLRRTNIADRFNWTLKGSPVTDFHLAQIIRMIEWKMYFTINKGMYGITVNDDFPLED